MVGGSPPPAEPVSKIESWLRKKPQPRHLSRIRNEVSGHRTIRCLLGPLRIDLSMKIYVYAMNIREHDVDTIRNRFLIVVVYVYHRAIRGLNSYFTGLSVTFPGFWLVSKLLIYSQNQLSCCFFYLRYRHPIRVVGPRGNTNILLSVLLLKRCITVFAQSHKCNLILLRLIHSASHKL